VGNVLGVGAVADDAVDVGAHVIREADIEEMQRARVACLGPRDCLRKQVALVPWGGRATFEARGLRGLAGAVDGDSGRRNPTLPSMAQGTGTSRCYVARAGLALGWRP